MFPNIKIYNKSYPTVILGEDIFTDWFSKCKTQFKDELERANRYKEVLDEAYRLGVRGYSISPHKTLLNMLKKFKQKHRDIICIANPHYQSHYYLNEQSLWEKPIWNKVHNTVDKKLGNQYNSTNLLSKKEISQIRIDVDEFKKQIKRFSDFCDFCIVGNYGNSCLQVLGRIDIIEKEIEIVKDLEITPLGICEAGGICLDLMRDINVDGFWVKVNRDTQIPSPEEFQQIVSSIKKPITAYKVFSLKDGFDLVRSIEFIKSIPQIQSIVVGVNNTKQAKETFQGLQDYF